MKKIDFKKKDVKYIKLKTPASEPLFDLLAEIDNFLKQVKHSDLDEEEKAKILNSYRKLVINLSDTFKKVANKYDLEFNEPLSIKMMRELLS